MGQSASIEEESQEIRAFTNNYVFVKKFTDTRFGEVKLLQEKTNGTKVLQRDYTSHSAKDYQDYLKECKVRVALTHPNAVKLHGYSTKKEDAFCADFYKVSFYFECFDHDLEQEIHKRAQTKEYFDEAELWYILDSIVSAGAYFQTNNAPVGDIRPFNILITPGFDYKIVDQGIFGKRTLPNYFGLIQGLETKSHYLAPEIFKALKTNKKIAYSQYKADVFSLGMTLIEASNLEALDKCYDWDKFTFDEGLLAQALQKLRTRYSKKYVDVLEQMVHPSDELRHDFIALDKVLNPWRIEIRAKKNVRVIEVKEIIKPVEVVFKQEVVSKPVEAAKKSSAPPVKAEVKVDAHVDLDKRVQQAVQLTAETLSYQPQQYTQYNYQQYQPQQQTVTYHPETSYTQYVQQPQQTVTYHPETTYTSQYVQQQPQTVTYHPETVQYQSYTQAPVQTYETYHAPVEHKTVVTEQVHRSAPPTEHRTVETVVQPTQSVSYQQYDFNPQLYHSYTPAQTTYTTGQTYTTTEHPITTSNVVVDQHYQPATYSSQTYTTAPVTTTYQGQSYDFKDYKFDPSVFQGTTYTNYVQTGNAGVTTATSQIVDASPAKKEVHHEEAVKKSSAPVTGHDLHQSHTEVSGAYTTGNTYTGNTYYGQGYEQISHSYVAPTVQTQSTYYPGQTQYVEGTTYNTTNWHPGTTTTTNVVETTGQTGANGQQVYTFDYTVPQGMSVNQFLNQLGIKEGANANVTVTEEKKA